MHEKKKQKKGGEMKKWQENDMKKSARSEKIVRIFFPISQILRIPGLGEKPKPSEKAWKS